MDVGAIDGARVSLMFDRGQEHAEKVLKHLSFALPSAKAIEPYLHELIERAQAILGPGTHSLHLRSNVFLLHKTDLILRYSANMEGDQDATMRLHFTAGLTGFCYVQRRPQICNLERIRRLAELGDLNAVDLFGMDPGKHGLVRSDRTWLASVPIFDPYVLYPIDLGVNAAPAGVEQHGHHYHSAPSPYDGAVLGVLNLDGNIAYTEVGISDDPVMQWQDLRIRVIVDVMQAIAAQIANVLSAALGRCEN